MEKNSLSVKQSKINYPEIQSNSLKKIAEKSVKWVHSKLNQPVFVEDSGLFIDSLKGFPGPFSSYIYSTLGNQGILKLVGKGRKAKFKSFIAYKDKDNCLTFKGLCRGKIAKKPRGNFGFGFDPIFIPKGNKKTFAEDWDFKNKVSHRKNSLKNFKRWLKENL